MRSKAQLVTIAPPVRNHSRRLMPEQIRGKVPENSPTAETVTPLSQSGFGQARLIKWTDQRSR